MLLISLWKGNYFYSFFQNILDDKKYMEYNILSGSVEFWVKTAGERKTLLIELRISKTVTEL